MLSFLCQYQEIILLWVNEAPEIHSAFKRMIDKLLLLLFRYCIFFGFLVAFPSPGRAGPCFCNYVDPAIRSHVKIHRLEIFFVSSLSMHQSEQECSIWRHRNILMEEPKYRRIKSLYLGTALEKILHISVKGHYRGT